MAKSHNGRGKEMNQDKGKAVEVAMGQIEKQYGKGSIMRLGAQGGARGRAGLPEVWPP